MSSPPTLARNRPLYSLTLLFLLVVILVSSLAAYRINLVTRTQVLSSLQTVLNTTRNGLHLWSGLRFREIRERAASTALIQYSNQLLLLHRKKMPIRGSAPLLQLREHLNPLLLTSGDHGFFVIAPDRISIASQRDSNLETLNLIQRQRPDYLDRVFAGETLFIPTVASDVPLSSPRTGETLQPVSIFIATPIRSDGRIVAAFTLRLDPGTSFNAQIQLGRIGRTGETYAFDRQGLLISESRFDEQLRRIGLIPPDQTGMLSIRIADPGGNLLTGHRPRHSLAQRPLTRMAESATAGQQGSDTEGYRDYRGVHVVGAWLWDDHLGIGLTTEMDLEEATGPYRQTRNNLIAVVTISVTMAVLLLWRLELAHRRHQKDLVEAYGLLEKRVEQRTSELSQARDKLKRANRDLAILADTDPLTGLANRRRFDQQLKLSWRYCYRERRNLAIILFDIDHFKAYNDTHGHPAGDRCLIRIADILREAAVINRPGDLLARFGGEEFIAVLADPSQDYAEATAEKIRHCIQRAGIEHNTGSGSPVLTVSVGLAWSDELRGTSMETLLEQADRALYLAKNRGRNCVVSNRE